MKPTVMQFEVLKLLKRKLIIFILVEHLLDWHLRDCRVDKTLQVSIEFLDGGCIKKCIELSVPLLQVSGEEWGFVSRFHRFC